MHISAFKRHCHGFSHVTRLLYSAATVIFLNIHISSYCSQEQPAVIKEIIFQHLSENICTFSFEMSVVLQLSN